jgi:hypothetical protein
VRSVLNTSHAPLQRMTKGVKEQITRTAPVLQVTRSKGCALQFKLVQLRLICSWLHS